MRALTFIFCLGLVQPAWALAPSDSGLHHDAVAEDAAPDDAAVDAAIDDAATDDAAADDAATTGDPAPPINLRRPDASDEQPVIRILPPSPSSSPPAARPHLGARDGGVAPLSTGRLPRHAAPRAADAGAPTQTWVKGLAAGDDPEAVTEDVGCSATRASRASLPLMSVLGVVLVLVRRRGMFAR